MRFPTSFLDDIRDRVPISTIVARRVTFDRKKSNPGRGDFWACCPFHGEKSPSFHCEDRKGRYHCFGCGVTGDHFRYLTELEGFSFPEAVETVAGIAGIPMPAQDEQAEKRDREQASLFDVMDMAATYFQEQLQAANGAKARGYLRERGLSAATQLQFRLGYSSDSRNALKEYLAGKGIPKDQIEACGLVVHGDDIPVSYDRFRDRIMFPIPDSRGRIIAFGGRALSKDVPAKYLNSPDTELFHKGQVLFNYAKARKPAQDKGTVIAVEGYMDVIAIAQAGFHHAVAPLGTALTERQSVLLWKMANEPILCFDGDQAGTKAAWRAADLVLPLLKPGKTFRFAMLPDGKDPDDVVKTSGPEAFQAVLDEARPLIDLIWMRETSSSVFDTPERRAELEQRLREITSRIQDESVRRHYQQDMRDRLASFFGSNNRSKGSQQRGEKQPYQAKTAKTANNRIAILDSTQKSALVSKTHGAILSREATLLMFAIFHPTLIEEKLDEFVTLDFQTPVMIELHKFLIDIIASKSGQTSAQVVSEIEGTKFLETFNLIKQNVRNNYLWVVGATASIDDARQAFEQALNLKRRTGILREELKAAEVALGNDPTDENFAHLLEIQKQIKEAMVQEALIEGFGVSSGRGNSNGN